MSSLFLMVTITDRRSTDAFLQLYQQRGVDVNLRTVGSGTAVRETLATLGLEKTEKAVLLAVVTITAVCWPRRSAVCLPSIHWPSAAPAISA